MGQQQHPGAGQAARAVQRPEHSDGSHSCCFEPKVSLGLSPPLLLLSPPPFGEHHFLSALSPAVPGSLPAISCVSCQSSVRFYCDAFSTPWIKVSFCCSRIQWFHITEPESPGVVCHAPSLAPAYYVLGSASSLVVLSFCAFHVPFTPLRLPGHLPESVRSSSKPA